MLLDILILVVQQKFLQIDAIEVLELTCPQLHTGIQKYKLKRKVIHQYGFPSKIRLQSWMKRLNVKKLMKDMKCNECDGTYFCNLIGISKINEAAPLETTGREGEIERDVYRTFPTIPFFSSGDGQRQLANVLKGVALASSEVSYCQGMNYIAAMLILLLEEEHCSTNDKTTTQTRIRVFYKQDLSTQEATFWLMLGFINKLEMGEVWKPKLPGLSRCIYLYQRLLQIHFEDLYNHLRTIGMHPSFLVTQWFVTVFARVFQPSFLVRIWDLFIIDGWKMIYRIALALTSQLQDQLLQMENLEACSEFFRQHPKLYLDDMSLKDLLSAAFSFKVTRKKLQKFTEERHYEYLRLRLSERPLSEEHVILFPSLLDAQAKTIEQSNSFKLIRQKLDVVDSNMSHDTAILRKKIEDANKRLMQKSSILYSKTYELSELTFEVEEYIDLRSKLRHQLKQFFLHAVAEASAPFPSPSSSRIPSRSESFRRVSNVSREKLLSLQSSALSMAQYTLYPLTTCLDRIIPLESSRNSTNRSRLNLEDQFSPQENDILENDESRDHIELMKEIHTNLDNLKVLVPSLAMDLQVLLKKLEKIETHLKQVRRKFKERQVQYQLARVDVEEEQNFKNRLRDQVVQMLEQTEIRKNETMSELFAKVDNEGTS